MANTESLLITQDHDIQAPESLSPYSHTEEEIKLFPEPASEYPHPLRGFLTIPSNRIGPFPALILLNGSGANDADLDIGINAPYRDLARGLSDFGTIVVRADKPSYGKRLKDFPHATVQWEYVYPALASLKLLMNHSKVDKERVYILGHSLGADMASLVFLAAQKGGFERLPGFIMLSGGGRPLHHIALEQVQTALEKTKDEKLKEYFSKLEEKMARQVYNIDHRLTGLEPPDPDEGPDSFLFGAGGPYWMSMRDLNWVKLIRESLASSRTFNPVRVMIAQGTNDFQVTLDLDFKVFQDAFDGNPQVTFFKWPGLNHLLSSNTNVSEDGEYLGRHEINKMVFRDVTGWISDASSYENMHIELSITH